MTHSDLLKELENVLHPISKTLGTLTVTYYVPTGILSVFLDEVLPVWIVENHMTAGSEADAARRLYMLQIARGVHLVLQAYHIGVQDLYSIESFEQSPVIVEMLQICWREKFMEERVESLEMARTFVELILDHCPYFYTLYNRKKSEYDHIVHTLDTKNLTSWSKTCRCHE